MNTARPEFGAGKARVQKPVKAKAAATPTPPTKLPKGPPEGSLTPADKATPTKTKMTQAEQSAEFERVAREHGAEGDEKSFNGALRKLTKPRN